MATFGLQAVVAHAHDCGAGQNNSRLDRLAEREMAIARAKYAAGGCAGWNRRTRPPTDENFPGSSNWSRRADESLAFGEFMLTLS